MLYRGWYAYDWLIGEYYLPHAYNVVMFSLFFFLVLFKRFGVWSIIVLSFVYSLNELSWSVSFFPVLYPMLISSNVVQIEQVVFVAMLAISSYFVLKKKIVRFRYVEILIPALVASNILISLVWFFISQADLNWQYHLFYLGLMSVLLWK